MDRKKEGTRRKIIAVSVELFNQFGLDAVTMEQIADVADIARGTLYNYFPCKEAIINAYIQLSFQDRNDDRMVRLRALPDTRARLTAVFTDLVAGVKRQKQIFEAFMVYRMKNVLSFHPLPEAERSGLSLLVHEIIRLGQAAGELRADLPETMLEGLFEYALIAAIKPFYLEPETFDPQKTIVQSIDLFICGARA
jgi:AcrR family transcriptional regulator